MPDSQPSELIATCRRRDCPERQDRAWFADVDLGDGKTASYQIHAPDPWDFNIEAELPVRISVDGKSCRILARLKNNKRYVRIGVPPTPSTCQHSKPNCASKTETPN